MLLKEQRITNVQRTVVVAGLVMVALLALVPPWVQTFRAHVSVTPLGYRPIYSPPLVREGEYSRECYSIAIDLPRAAFSLLAAARVTAAAVIALGPEKAQ